MQQHFQLNILGLQIWAAD